MKQRKFLTAFTVLTILILAVTGCNKNEPAGEEVKDPNSVDAIIGDFNKLPGCDYNIRWGKSYTGEEGYLSGGTGCKPKDLNQFREFVVASKDLRERINKRLKMQNLNAAQTEVLTVLSMKLGGFPTYNADRITESIEKAVEILNSDNVAALNVISKLSAPGANQALSMNDFVSSHMASLLKVLPKLFKETFWYEMDYKEIEVGPGIKFGQIFDLNYNYSKHAKTPIKNDLQAGFPAIKIDNVIMNNCDMDGMPCEYFYQTLADLKDLLLSDEVKTLGFETITIAVISDRKEFVPSLNATAKNKELYVRLRSNFYDLYPADNMKQDFEKALAK